MAAKDAKRKIRQVMFNAQSADHPIIRGREVSLFKIFDRAGNVNVGYVKKVFNLINYLLRGIYLNI